MLQDTLAENEGTPPAKVAKLETDLPYMSNASCSAPAVQLEGETSSCSSPHITESVFNLQRRIHSEKNAQESVLFSPEIMKRIFCMLDLAEQNNFRLVCKQWYKMAHEYWLKSSFDCGSKIEQLKRVNEDDLDGCFESLLSLIKDRPLLKSIRISNLDDHKQHSEVLDTVLIYVEDLHHIELRYAIFPQVKFLVNKYKNLKSVKLHITSRNLAESVKCLGKCENLENLIFLKDDDIKNDRTEREFAAVCTALADNYPKLRSLTMISIESPHMAEQLKYLLQRRSTTFSSLKLAFWKDCYDYGNVLKLCTNLEELMIMLRSPNTPFHFSGLNKYNNLFLLFSGIYSNEVVVETLGSIQCNGPQTKFFLVLLGSTKYSTTLQRSQVLTFHNSTAMNELNDVSGLKNVLCISILGRYITEYITKSIAKCESLEILALEHCTLTEPALLGLKHCTSLKALLLVNSELKLSSIIQVVKSLPNLKIFYAQKWRFRSLDILRKFHILRE